MTGALILRGLLPQLSCLIEVSFEVASELAGGEEASLEPVKLIKDRSERHRHALLHLLANALDHALSVDALTHQSLEKVTGLGR